MYKFTAHSITYMSLYFMLCVLLHLLFDNSNVIVKKMF